MDCHKWQLAQLFTNDKYNGDDMKKVIIAKGRPMPFLPASYLWNHSDIRLIYTADTTNL